MKEKEHLLKKYFDLKLEQFKENIPEIRRILREMMEESPDASKEGKLQKDH